MSIRPLVALDVGATKVACAIGLPHEGRAGFELMGIGLAPYPSLSATWLPDPVVVSRTIEQALEAAAVTGELDRALVAISHPQVASEQVRVTMTLGDEPMAVRARDLARLQTAALNQVLSVDREPLLVERLGCTGNGFDGVRDPRGLSATRLAGVFHILTLPMAARRAVVQAVEAAGLDVVTLSSTLPAVLAAVDDPGLARGRVLLVDLGGVATTIGLSVDGALQAAKILPSGGVSLAAAIAKTLGVTTEQALTWSLEGTACRKPEVRKAIEGHLQAVGEAIAALVSDQPKPDAVVVSGRGALMDGCMEWLERATGCRAILCRNGRISQTADLSRQVGLSTALGMLELATRTSNGMPTSAPRFFNRVIDRTRTILAEYF